MMEENFDFATSEEHDEFKEIYDIPKIKKPSIIRKILFNVLGFYGGYYIGALAVQIAHWFLFDVLSKVKFIISILSWPVDYSTYALTGVILIDAAVSLNACAFISRFGKAKRNYSCFVLGAFRVIAYVSSLIETVISDGFNFAIVWTMAILLFQFIMITISTANNEEF